MRNVQLNPTYNLKMAPRKQFILNYEDCQNPTDAKTLRPFLEKNEHV